MNRLLASHGWVVRVGRALSATAATLVCACAWADVSLAPLFSNGAVLQRDRALPVWGWADAGEAVTVVFKQQHRRAVAGADGRWRVDLAPEPASAIPSELIVSGKNVVRVRNVLVGEVWLCSGQSNMEWSVATALNATEEAADADFPAIRHAKVTRTVSDEPASRVVLAWQECTPQSASRFAAVPYFFAREMHQRLGGVPIGVVTSAWGGTEIEAWIPPDALRADERFSVVFERWTDRLARFPQDQARQQAALAKWEREKAAAEARGEKYSARRPAPAEGPGSRWTPGGLYQGMIHPLVPFAFRSVLWYQGEANEFRPNEYGPLFRTLITRWRDAFGDAQLPFYFVQLANFSTANDPTEMTWAGLREAQASVLDLPATGMVVTIDIGEDHNIHYPNKQEVGRRLALLARAQIFGEDVATSGPTFKSLEPLPGALRVHFAHANALAAPSGVVSGFEVAGADGVFVAADARIENDAVIVHAAGVTQPVAVRYCWHNTPSPSLFNAAGLPAAPFRASVTRSHSP